MWRVVPGQSLAFREWDGEAVLYNDLSGNTHLIDGLGIDLLLALQGSPADIPTLAARLAGQVDADAGELSAAIEDMLAGLSALDLVEPFPC
jgi:PqqD family protein of HPr-rel-A system